MLQAVKLIAGEEVPRLSSRCRDFSLMYDTLVNKIRESSLSEVLQVVIDTINYAQYLEKKYPAEASDKLANIYELGAALADYEAETEGASLESWLADIALSGSEKEEDGGVCLMTLHAAKGLSLTVCT